MVLCLAGTALATSVTATPSAAKGITTTTVPPNTGPLAPVVRAGQPYITPGHQATAGPIGANPSMAHGVQLSVLNGLLNGLPIFNGDFADPYALVDGDSVYTYATSTTASAYCTGGAHPRHRHHACHGLRRPLPGRRPPDAADVDRGGVPVGAVGLGPPGRDVRHVLLDAGDPATRLRLQRQGAGCVTTTHGANTAMCISRATSTSPSGPFVDDSSSAFICPTSQGGAIDPSIFVASDGTPWLLWKSDGDCCNLPTYIYSQQLSADGLSTVGPPHELIGATQAWEGGLVEAPSMVQSGSTFWMFYSANLWGTPNYSIGIAKCASVTGPCTKPLDRAWHTSTNSANGQGYGGSEFFVAGGGLVWMVHHGLVPGQSGNYAERRLYVDLMVFPKKGLPKIAPRAAAAALAVEALYYQDPDLPVAAPGRLPPHGLGRAGDVHRGQHDGAAQRRPAGLHGLRQAGEQCGHTGFTRQATPERLPVLRRRRVRRGIPLPQPAPARPDRPADRPRRRRPLNPEASSQSGGSVRITRLPIHRQPI